MARRHYSAEQLDFIRTAYLTMRIQDVTAAFNARFEQNRTQNAIRSATKNHNMRAGRKGKSRLHQSAWKYTPEVLEFLRDNYRNMTQPELRVDLKNRFGLSLTRSALNGALKKYGISCGRTGQFVKGQNSWNNGKKGYIGANRTSFKKGNVPWTKKPLYSESVNRDGYIQIIVPERNPWTGAETRSKHKHLWLWERANGPLPKGHAVIFVDGDNRNFALENLLCIHRKVLVNLNLHGYKNAPAEVKPSILALAQLEAEAGIRTIRAPGAGRKKGTPNKPKTEDSP